MVDSKAAIKLIDMGYAKKIQNSLTHSFCGTPHSMAPELFNRNLENEGYGYSVDYYGVGILYYELLVGYPPNGYNEKEIKKKIKIPITINEDVITDPLHRDLFNKLL